MGGKLYRVYAVFFLLVVVVSDFASSEEFGGEYNLNINIKIRQSNNSFVLTDIDELNLTFNQIKNLISNFNNDNLVKAVNFAEETTQISKK